MDQIRRKSLFYRTKKLLGVKVDYISLANALKAVKSFVESNKQYQISTPNPEHIIVAQHDYRFKKILNNCALNIPDGIGLVWAAKLFGWGRVERLSGVDLMLALSKLASKKKWRIFLLGAKENAAAQAAAYLISNFQFPISNVAFSAGAKNIKSETKKEHSQTIKQINKFKPHLLFVAYGAPMQEKWIAENLEKLNVKVAMGVGGAFDYLSNKVKRAPRFVRRLGLEWLWRLILEPWRWRRQVRLLKFIYLVILEKLTFDH